MAIEKQPDGTGSVSLPGGVRPESVGFFAALGGVCRGTDIFMRLRFQHPLRAIFHFFLLLVILALAVVITQTLTINREIDRVTGEFKAVFGGVSIDANKTLRPLHRPTDSRSMLLPGGGILTYVPGGVIPALPEKTGFTDFRYLIYWFPGDFVLAHKIGEGEVACAVMQPGKMLPEQHRLNAANFNRLLQQSADQGPKQGVSPGEVKEVSADEVASWVKMIWTALSFFMFVVVGFVQLMIYVLLFVGMFFITGARQLKVLKMKQLWVCALYAGLPAMMVGAAFPAFDLPLLTFDSAFVIGMVSYLLVVIGRVERGNGGGEEKKNE